MKVLFNAWIPREVYPQKPPFFDWKPTWVAVHKITLEKFDEVKIKAILSDLSDEFDTKKFKVLIFEKGRRGFKTIRYDLVN